MTYKTLPYRNRHCGGAMVEMCIVFIVFIIFLSATVDIGIALHSRALMIDANARIVRAMSANLGEKLQQNSLGPGAALGTVLADANTMGANLSAAFNKQFTFSPGIAPDYPTFKVFSVAEWNATCLFCQFLFAGTKVRAYSELLLESERLGCGTSATPSGCMSACNSEPTPKCCTLCGTGGCCNQSTEICELTGPGAPRCCVPCPTSCCPVGSTCSGGMWCS